MAQPPSHQASHEGSQQGPRQGAHKGPHKAPKHRPTAFRSKSENKSSGKGLLRKSSSFWGKSMASLARMRLADSHMFESSKKKEFVPSRSVSPLESDDKLRTLESDSGSDTLVRSFTYSGTSGTSGMASELEVSGQSEESEESEESEVSEVSDAESESEPAAGPSAADSQQELVVATAENTALVLELDLECNVRFISRTWRKIVGTDIARIVRKPISKIIVGEEKDKQVFSKATQIMMEDDESYRVRFIVQTNLPEHKEPEEPEEPEDPEESKEQKSGSRSDPANSTLCDEEGTPSPPASPPNSSVSSLASPFLTSSHPSGSSENDSASIRSSSSTITTDGGFIELEAQGILIHNQATGQCTHTMWVVKPWVALKEFDLEMPAELVSSLGFGADLFETYLLKLAEIALIDKAQIPTPPLELCRICEQQVPNWWLEKHTELCAVEHRVEDSVYLKQEQIQEHRNLLKAIYQTILRQSEDLHEGSSTSGSSSASMSVSSSLSSNLSVASTVSEYRGMPIPLTGAAKRTMPRRFPLLNLEILLEYCDEALQINVGEIKVDPVDPNGRDIPVVQSTSEEDLSVSYSPDSTRHLHNMERLVLQDSSDPAIQAMTEDTLALCRQKLDCLTRYAHIQQYVQRITNETDMMVLQSVTATLEKIKEQVLGVSDSDDEFVLEGVRGLDIRSPQPTRPSDYREAQVKQAASPAVSASGSVFRTSVHRIATPRGLRSRPGSRPVSMHISGTSTPHSIHSTHSNTSRSTPVISVAGDEPQSSSGAVVAPMATSFSALSNNGSQSGYASPRRPLSPAFSIPLSSIQRNPRGYPKSAITGTGHSTLSRAASPFSSPLLISTDPNDLNGSIQSPLSPLLVPQPVKSIPPSIQDYEVVKPISKGAFGSVFLVRRKLTGEYLAMKVLKKTDMVAKNQVTNVKAERAIMMAQTDSPYVVQLVASFQAKNYLYLVMEYMNGGDLATLLRNMGTMPDGWAKRYIAEVIVGVDDLHRKGTLHRDLKPDNLLVDRNGHVKLTDFGLSRMGLVKRQSMAGTTTGGGAVRQVSDDTAERLSLFSVGSVGSVSVSYEEPRSPVGSVKLGHSGSTSAHGRTSSVASNAVAVLGHSVHASRGSGTGLLYGHSSSSSLDETTPRRQNSVAKVQQRTTATAGHRPSSITPFSLSPGSPLSSLATPTSDVEMWATHGAGTSLATAATLAAAANASAANAAFAASTAASTASGSGPASPSIRPLVHKTSQQNMFTFNDEERPRQPQQEITNFALFDPQKSTQTRRFVGTPDYLAPETVAGLGQEETSDWWSVGCILFEFLFGYTPFNGDTPEEVFDNILHGDIQWPSLPPGHFEQYCSDTAKDLIMQLLNKDPSKRLGVEGTEQIKGHPYFAGVSWDTLFEEEASFVPDPDNPESTEYFDKRGASMLALDEEEGLKKKDSDESSPMSVGDYIVRKGSISGPGLPGARGSRGSIGSLISLGQVGPMPPLGGTVPPTQSQGGTAGSTAGSAAVTPTFNVDPRSRSTSSGSPRQSGASKSVKHERRSSRLFNDPASSSEFGSFQFRNLAMAEKQNKDAVKRLKNEHRERRSSMSSVASSDSFNLSQSSPQTPLVPTPVASSGLGLAPNPATVATLLRTPSGRLSKKADTSSVHSSGMSPYSSDAEERTMIRRRSTIRRRSKRRLTGPSSSTGNSSVVGEDGSPSVGGKSVFTMDVLLCEPIPIQRFSIGKNLRKCGCDLVVVSGGSELIKATTGSVKFDLIFLSTELQRLNPVDLVKLIRHTPGINSDTRFVALTPSDKLIKSTGIYDKVIEYPITLQKLRDVLDGYRRGLFDDVVITDND